MLARPRSVEVYETASGSSPFDDWMRSLKDPVGKAAIDAKVALLRRGSLGNHRDVGDGVIELKVNVGPGSGYTLPTTEGTRSFCSLGRRTRRNRTSRPLGDTGPTIKRGNNLCRDHGHTKSD